jgi:hypothetical protein
VFVARKREIGTLVFTRRSGICVMIALALTKHKRKIASTCILPVNSRVNELQVGASRVGPAAVETLRCHEDGRLVGEDLEAIVLPSLAASVSAVGDLVHAASDPVQSVDKLVALVVLVVIRNADGELALGAADANGLDAGCDGWGGAASWTEGGNGHVSQASEPEEGGKELHFGCG